jgi:hypothetical protein
MRMWPFRLICRSDAKTVAAFDLRRRLASSLVPPAPPLLIAAFKLVVHFKPKD